MRLAEWIHSAAEELAEAGVDSPRLDAQILAAHALGRDRSWVLSHPEESVADSGLSSLLRRRLNREPLAYITGKREFYGREFFVDPDVLVPRQETEFVVERAKLWMHGGGDWTVLDVGTGSGCIGITLALECPGCRVTLLDKSMNALRVASKNADALEARIDQFVHSDLFHKLPKRRYQLVVSNPPYVAHADDLPPEVRDFEPHDALFADANGLAMYRRLAAETYLATGCEALIVEIGMGQQPAVEAVFAEYGWQLVDAMCDLGRIVRTLTFIPADVVGRLS
ncbi:MAG: peptide chain release factor N(5)-glutamine methyltransferase [Armatimonadetes bacterium]|nr:peptide chain release factor N(5)-glutamine methyltransferase [Armatimonadota bacterium]MBS1710880.1 peptide chain release factor N(5)-glutamine methyltransferase [Armatimonadota bacterium]MBX3108552.1 peptide chain release factor N(5)-glutamine methyltransferase [Fimbriimonadaceae bacterium]